MADIPKEVIEPIESKYELPQEIKELPQEIEAPEAIPYLISFAKYNTKMCELDILGNNKGKKAFETLKIIGTKVRSTADFQRNYIDRIPVRFEGEYKKLFNGLSPDIELKELKLQQNARIFYFDIEPERIIYIVAITENHLETNQTRR